MTALIMHKGAKPMCQHEDYTVTFADKGPTEVLDEIRNALEVRGYFHMANGRDIGMLLDRLAELEKKQH